MLLVQVQPAANFNEVNMSQWINVKDRLPVQEGYYLCTYIFDNHRFYFDRWFGEDGKFNTTNEITHWMPLPKVPKDE